MDFLRKALLTASLAVAFSPIALSIEVIRDGLQLEVVYCENEAGDSGCSPITHLSNGINDMALDPLTATCLSLNDSKTYQYQKVEILLRSTLQTVPYKT